MEEAGGGCGEGWRRLHSFGRSEEFAGGWRRLDGSWTEAGKGWRTLEAGIGWRTLEAGVGRPFWGPRWGQNGKMGSERPLEK